MRRSLPIVFALAFASACAPHSSPATAPARRDLVSEVSVKAHLEFLASDALNGRGSGTRDEQIAAEYIASEFRRLGLEAAGDDTSSGHNYVQSIEIERRALTAPPVLVAGSPDAPRTRWTHGKEILVSSLGADHIAGPLQRVQLTPTGPAHVTSGAIALVPKDSQPGAAMRLFEMGVAAILLPETPQIRARWQTSGQRLPGVRARIKGLGEQRPDRPSLIIVSAEAAAALEKMPEATPLSLEIPIGEPQLGHTFNAVAMLRGTDASADVIMITSHLDHLGRSDSLPGTDKIFNGADDDASGTVAVLELAAALARRGRPRRTIVFACFGSEEAGGYGATYLRERPPVPLERIAANVEFEMIGRPDPKVPAHTLWLTGYERSDLGAELAAHGARLVADPHPTENFFQRSDNYTLARRGVVAHTVSSYGLHKEYHTPADETRLVDYAHMREAIESMIAPLLWLANSDFRPQWKPGMKPV